MKKSVKKFLSVMIVAIMSLSLIIPMTSVSALTAIDEGALINETFSASIADLANSGVFSGAINAMSTAHVSDGTYAPTSVSAANLSDLFEITAEGTLKLKSTAAEGAQVKIALPAEYAAKTDATATLSFKFKASALPATGNLFTVRVDGSSNIYRGPAAVIGLTSEGFVAYSSGTPGRVISYTPGEWVTVNIAFAYGTIAWAPTFLTARSRIDGAPLSDVNCEASTRGGGVTGLGDIYFGIGGNWAGETFEIDDLQLSVAGGYVSGEGEATPEPTVAPTVDPSAKPNDPTVQIPGIPAPNANDQVYVDFAYDTIPTAAERCYAFPAATTASIAADPADPSNNVLKYIGSADVVWTQYTHVVGEAYGKNVVVSNRYRLDQDPGKTSLPIGMTIRGVGSRWPTYLYLFNNDGTISVMGEAFENITWKKGEWYNVACYIQPDLTNAANGIVYVEVSGNFNGTTDTLIKKQVTYDIPCDPASTTPWSQFITRVDVPAGSTGTTVYMDDLLIKTVDKVVIPEEPDEPDIVCGDVSGDGNVNALDRASIARYVSKYNGYETLPVIDAADVTNDGVVNALDRAAIARHVSKWTGYETLPFIK